MIVKVLEGKEIGEIPVEYPEKVELYLNPKVAEKIGIKIPTELIESTSYLIG